MALLDKLLGRNTMSDTLIAVEVNCATGEVTERPLTAAEIAQREADAQAAEARRVEEEAAKVAEETAKASAQAKLAALGLTSEEIAALSK
jgi:hypothetical protein